MAKAASAEFMNAPKQVLSFVRTCSLIDDGRQIQEIDVEEDWTAPLKEYLQSSSLPDEKDAARRLKVWASQFVLIKDALYKRGFSRPYLRCLSHGKVEYVMREGNFTRGFAGITLEHGLWCTNLSEPDTTGPLCLGMPNHT